jgi:hypothetical protein
MNLIVRTKDGSAVYRHENCLGREESITLEDRENGTLTLSIVSLDKSGQLVARYRMDCIDYWTTGEQISAESPEAQNPSGR